MRWRQARRSRLKNYVYKHQFRDSPLSYWALSLSMLILLYSLDTRMHASNQLNSVFVLFIPPSICCFAHKTVPPGTLYHMQHCCHIPNRRRSTRCPSLPGPGVAAPQVRQRQAQLAVANVGKALLLQLPHLVASSQQLLQHIHRPSVAVAGAASRGRRCPRAAFRPCCCRRCRCQAAWGAGRRAFAAHLAAPLLLCCRRDRLHVRRPRLLQERSAQQAAARVSHQLQRRGRNSQATPAVSQPSCDGLSHVTLQPSIA